MNIIKTYFKLIKKNVGPIIFMVSIFLFFSVTFMLKRKIDEDASQYSKKYKIAFFNKTEDKHTAFTQYLSSNFKIQDIDDNEESIKDALLLREIDYALIINDSGIQGYNMVVAIEGYMVKSQIEEYLSLQSIYETYGKEDINFVHKTLEQNTKVEFVDETEAKLISKRKQQSDYFNFSAYMLMSNIMGAVCLTALALRKKGVRERLKLSNTSSKSIELQLMLGNLLILIAMLALIFIVPLFIINDYILFTTQNLLLLINTTVFGLSIIGLGLLLSQMISNASIVGGITTIISLGSSFISGVFVGQVLLPKIAVNISKFFPTYWFVKGNQIISSSPTMSKEILLSYASGLGVIVLMGSVFFVIASLISKKKRMAV